MPISTCNITININEVFHFGCDVSKIHRRTQNDSIGLHHPGNDIINHIVFDVTASVLNLSAFSASSAAMNQLTTQLNELGFDTFIFQFLKYALYYDFSIAISVRTSVNSYNFHSSILKSNNTRSPSRLTKRQI